MNTHNSHISNDEVATRLEEAGKLLERHGANPFRATAYRRAADTIRKLPRPVGTIVTERGVDGLKALPSIGDSLAKSLERLVTTGRFSLLDRLRSQGAPESVLSTIGGIGPTLARRLHEEAGISTLADLEGALASGKLEKMPGFGEKRVRAIRESLLGRLHRESAAAVEPRTAAPTEHSVPNEPSVETLLDIDAEYRRKEKAKDLPRLTPKLFNPTKEAWLPLLKTERDGAGFTAMYSNTRRAHELGVTRDWVVVYRDERDGDGQWTVITSQYGALRGKRIVRGRELECRSHYERDAQGQFN